MNEIERLKQQVQEFPHHPGCVGTGNVACVRCDLDLAIAGWEEEKAWHSKTAHGFATCLKDRHDALDERDEARALANQLAELLAYPNSPVFTDGFTEADQRATYRRRVREALDAYEKRGWK